MRLFKLGTSLLLVVGLVVGLYACGTIDRSSSHAVKVGDLKTRFSFLNVAITEMGGYYEEPEAFEDLFAEVGAKLRPSGIYALSEDVIFLYGQLFAGQVGRSVLLRSTNGGQNWLEIMAPTRGSAVHHLTFTADGYGWALVGWTIEGPGPLDLYGTNDNGEHWQHLSFLGNQLIPFGIMRDSQLDGEIKIAHLTGNPYSDRLAIYSTNQAGREWDETSNVLIWPDFDADPKPAIDVTDRQAVNEYFTELAGWRNVNDGFDCRPICETDTTEDVSFRLVWDLDAEFLILEKRTSDQENWTRVTTIPTMFAYDHGKVSLMGQPSK